MPPAQQTIILRKINPKELYDAYIRGDFNTKDIASCKGTSLENIVFTTDKYQVGNFSDYTGSVRDKTNSLCRLGYSNISGPDNGNCDWCRRPLSTCSGSSESVGIPIKRVEVEDKIVYDVDGFYGTWECAYSDLVKHLEQGRSRLDPLYINSDVYINRIYAQMYPDKELETRKSYRVLKCNRGWMDDDEYDKNKSPFIRIPFIVLQHNKIINIC